MSKHFVIDGPAIAATEICCSADRHWILDRAWRPAVLRGTVGCDVLIAL